MLSHDSVVNYYKTNFGMIQHHNYSLRDLENMIPWEREIYVGLLLEYIEEEKRKMEEEARKNQNK